MSGNIWSVFWSGEWADMVRSDLLGAAGNGRTPVRCGGAGAVWTVANWSELTDGRVGALLMPADPHSAMPSVRVLELPIPNGAQPG
jgi:hypothetical protein